MPLMAEKNGLIIECVRETGGRPMKTITLIVVALLIAQNANAQSRLMRTDPVAPCALASQTVTTEENSIALSSCGVRAFVYNDGPDDLLVTTATLNNYVVYGGTARTITLGNGDTIMTLHAISGTSNVKVEQCAPNMRCRWITK